MTITPYVSDKLKVLSFASIILVLYIHSGYHDLPNEIQGMPFNHTLQAVIGGRLGQLAVPLFFMISGYLYFRNISLVRDCLPKMRRRAATLLVPFIIAYLLSPWVFIALWIPAGILLPRLLPRLYGICVGGR